MILRVATTTTFLIFSLSSQSGIVVSEVCDYIEDGTGFDINADEKCSIVALDPLFYSMLESTEEASIATLLENYNPIFHEGPVLFQDDDEFYFTTNRLGNTSIGATWGRTAPPQMDQYIDIYKLDLLTNELTIIETDPPIQMVNGMTKSADGRNILALSQGIGTGEDTNKGGVYLIDRQSLTSTPIVNTYYGNDFNSLNDIKTTSDGILFVSDPVYGFEQGFRAGVPALGGNVYRYDSNSKNLQIISTELRRPNGVALLDGRLEGEGRCTLFLTDTGFETAAQSPRGFDSSGDSAVYKLQDDSGTCFGPDSGPWPMQPVVIAASGIQDGIQVHENSKTLLYCDGDGVWVWSIPKLKPLGVIRGGCTQLQFSQGNGVQTIYILSETRLRTAKLNFNGAAELLPPNSDTQRSEAESGFDYNSNVSSIA